MLFSACMYVPFTSWHMCLCVHILPCVNKINMCMCVCVCLVLACTMTSLWGNGNPWIVTWLDLPLLSIYLSISCIHIPSINVQLTCRLIRPLSLSLSLSPPLSLSLYLSIYLSLFLPHFLPPLPSNILVCFPTVSRLTTTWKSWIFRQVRCWAVLWQTFL